MPARTTEARRRAPEGKWELRAKTAKDRRCRLRSIPKLTGARLAGARARPLSRIPACEPRHGARRDARSRKRVRDRRVGRVRSRAIGFPGASSRAHVVPVEAVRHPLLVAWRSSSSPRSTRFLGVRLHPHQRALVPLGRTSARRLRHASSARRSCCSCVFGVLTAAAVAASPGARGPQPPALPSRPDPAEVAAPLPPLREALPRSG